MSTSAPGPTLVVRAGVDEVERVRAARLRALGESPDAFWTTLAESEAMPLPTWRARLADPAAASFLAVRDGADVGLVFGTPHHDIEGEAGLYGMWVASQARRGRVGRLLIEAVIGWAREAGFPRLRLEVADANAAAVATYRALGFTPTGRRGAMPAPRDHLREHELALDLNGLRPSPHLPPGAFVTRPTPEPAGPGQTSVWTFPRPPRVVPDGRRAVLRHGGVVVADTTDLVKVLETSHPPTFYLPRAAFGEFLRPTEGTSYCEWKGAARYVDLVVPGARPLTAVGWWYPDPNQRELRDRVAVYAAPFTEITLDGERVLPQPGGFYGGWITADLAGPFKGGPGTQGW